MKKVLFGLATMAFSGTALSATFTYTLVNLATGSSNGSAAATLYGGVEYTYDEASPGELTKTAAGGTTFYFFDVSGTALMTYAMQGLTVGNGAADATAYSCIEGSFGAVVGASICGNYTLGSNGIDQSIVDYSTVPGTRTLNGNPGTIGADDVSSGAMQQVTDLACTINSGTPGVSANLVCENALWNSAGTDDSGNPTGESTDGMQFIFALNPTAVDDGPFLAASSETINIDVLGNDTVFDDIQDLTVTAPTQGTAVVVDTNSPFPSPQAGLSIDYTAPAGFTGPATFDYAVTDANSPVDASGNPVPVTATVTINNLLPDAVDDNPNVPGDAVTPVETDIQVAANDTYGDTSPGVHTVTIDTPPANGTIGAIAGCDVKATCVVPYTPDANFFGADPFTYILTDGNGDTDTATVTVNVVSGATPSASDDNIETDTMLAVAFNPLTNDVGLAVEPLSITFAQGSNGAVIESVACTTQAACELTYTPTGNFAGNDSFTYTIADNNGADDTATVNVFVNDLPVAVADPAMTADTGVAVDLDVQANDTGLSETPVSVTVSTPPANGTAVPDGNNPQGVTYTSDADFVGVDTFEYTLTDSLGRPNPDTSAPALVTVTVDDQPVAADDGTMIAPAYMVPEGATMDLDVLANDSGLNDTPLTITITTNGTFGTATGASGDETTPVSYAAGPSMGVDQFVYRVTDNSGDFDEATAYVAVTDADIPMAIDDAADTDIDTPVTVNVLANDTGLADTPLSITIQTDPTNGTIGAIAGCDQQVTCQVPYTPDSGFTGTDTFEYFVTDSTPDVSNIATVTITVNDVVDVPDAVDDEATVELTKSVSIDVLDNDTGISNVPLTVTITTEPSLGTAVVEADNSVTYTAPGGDRAVDTFEYTVTDDNGASSTALVEIILDYLGGEPPPNQNTLPGKNSAMGPLSLLALLFAPLLRRLRRRTR